MIPWLDIVGIGADGTVGLAPAARAALQSAEIVFGAERHHALVPDLAAERRTWPRPYRPASESVAPHRGRRVAVLVTGDPLWFSAGSDLAAAFDPAEVTVHPHPSAFQLAAARLGWPLEHVETLSAHGRPLRAILPLLAPGARLLLLARDGATAPDLAALLAAAGFGDSPLTALANLGGPDETHRTTPARAWAGRTPDLVTLAVDCRADPGATLLPRTGLPDDAFLHDGQMTKREVRALTLARLAPRPGQRLWDVGAGCGSIAIEWMRAAHDTTAIALEPDPDRRAMTATNADRLGTPGLQIVDGTAPEALASLPPPDAIFIGGGLSRATVARCRAALPPHGRLVANAVTLESGALLADLHAEHGGDLVRLSVARAEPVGRFRGWRTAMPVTQWTLTT